MASLVNRSDNAQAYRYYVFAADNRVMFSDCLADCRDDEEAIRRARELATTADVELWCGSRRLDRFKASNASFPAATSTGARTYRYYVSALDGHGAYGSWMQCSSDEEAIEKAKKLIGDNSGEVWESGRMIAIFDARKGYVWTESKKHDPR